MKKIIMFENLPFKSGITVGSHHYAKLFSDKYKVLWVSLPFNPIHFYNGLNNERFKAWNFNKEIYINNNFITYTPFSFLIYRNSPVLKSQFIINNYINFWLGFKRKIKKLNFNNPDYLWFTDPRHISILKFFKKNKIIYRCVDNLECFEDIPNDIIKYEKSLIEKSDFVFFTANDLKEKFIKNEYNEKFHYLPNGCDYDFFSKKNITDNIAKKFFKKDKINLLYIGAISDWFDFDAIEIISQNKKINFVIIGPIRVEIPKKVLKNKNVNFLGPFEYKYMNHFTSLADIGIIPFKVNEMTDSVNPIKLYEYMAAGLPVLSSAFKTIKGIKGPFEIYDNYDIINNKIIDLFNSKSILKIKEIKKFARYNSWKSRFEYIENIFKRKL